MNTVDRKNINTVNEDQGLGVEKCEPVKKRVTIAQDARDANATSPSPATTPPTSGRQWLHKVCLWFSSKLGWVLQNWTWSKIKPAIRCAVVGWLSAVLFIVPSVQLILGQVSNSPISCAFTWFYLRTILGELPHLDRYAPLQFLPLCASHDLSCIFLTPKWSFPFCPRTWSSHFDIRFDWMGVRTRF